MKVLLIIAAIALSGFAPGFSDYEATAYHIKGRTASGMITQRGVIAADPKVLKLGTRVHIRAGKYSGEYVVHDTGSRIKGRRVDIWMPEREALTFGRRNVKLKVLAAS